MVGAPIPQQTVVTPTPIVAVTMTIIPSIAPVTTTLPSLQPETASVGTSSPNQIPTKVPLTKEPSQSITPSSTQFPSVGPSETISTNPLVRICGPSNAAGTEEDQRSFLSRIDFAYSVQINGEVEPDTFLPKMEGALLDRMATRLLFCRKEDNEIVNTTTPTARITHLSALPNVQRRERELQKSLSRQELQASRIEYLLPISEVRKFNAVVPRT